MIIFRWQFIFFRFALFITLVFRLGPAKNVRQWWQIKKIHYMLICMAKGRPSLVYFMPYAKPPATQSSITCQKVYTIFERNFYAALTEVLPLLSMLTIVRAFDIYKSGPFVLCCFFWLAAHMLPPLTHIHMTQTHFYAAICFRLPWHTLIHFSHLLRTHTRTHITLRHTVSCIMKFSNQFA